MQAARIAWVEGLQAFIYCLGRSRFSVIILLVGIALLLCDQGQDQLIANAEDGKTARLALAAAFWALSIWGWCRVLLDIRYDSRPGNVVVYNLWRKWLPRLLGTAAFLVLGLAAFRASQYSLVGWALGGLVLFLFIVVMRRDISGRVAERLSNARSPLLKGLAPAFAVAKISRYEEPPHASLREALHMPPAGTPWYRGWGVRGAIAAGMLISFCLLCTAAFLVPVPLGRTSGALILFFLWAGTWLPLGSIASYWADHYGVPLLTVLIVAAAAFSLSNDNHEIPSTTGMTDIGQRPTLDEALGRWVESQPRAANPPVPLVIVATAGGGIRAAYWTGTVLGELDRTAPGFRDRLFAISGVSGGSVGATVFRALTDLPRDQFESHCADGITRCAQDILAADSLGPLAAALLYPDLGQWFLPLPWFPDRAAALEQAWEMSFKDKTDQDSLVGALADLSRTKPWPALFLNATWSNNGHRIVASNLRIGSTPDTPPDPATRFSDQLGVIGHDLKLSSAAHNSARFPYVSPAGMWRKDGKVAGRLQDGGLFENFGAETALDLLNGICTTVACEPGGGNGPRVTPVVVMITSSPSLPANLAELPPYKVSNFSSEFGSTPSTYEAVRNGRGIEVALRLQGWSRRHGDHFFVFRMCESDSEGASPPLGWALSNAARQRIDSFLLPPHDGNTVPACFQENQAALLRLAALLAGAGN